MHGMQFFHLQHPGDEVIVCDRDNCGGIADYLEVEEDGTEHRLCAIHTRSDKYVAGLSLRAPNDARSYRSKSLV